MSFVRYVVEFTHNMNKIKAAEKMVQAIKGGRTYFEKHGAIPIMTKTQVYDANDDSILKGAIFCVSGLSLR